MLFILLNVSNFKTSQVLSFLNSLRVSIVGSKLAAISSLAAIIGASLAAFVLIKQAHDYMQGQGIVLWSLLRPFVILLCICNFNSFVAGPIHSICNVFTEGMSNMVDVSAEKYINAAAKSTAKQFKESGASFVDNVRETKKQNSGDIFRFRDKQDESNWFKRSFMNAVSGIVTASYGIGEVGKQAQDLLMNFNFMWIINPILNFLMSLVMFGQRVYCYVYLTILSLLGPFAFAFGILGSFSSTIQSWIARYIQIAFWIPVGQVIMYINYSIVNSISELTASYGFGSSTITSVALIVSILNILAVPKISAYVIDSTGANGAHDNVNSIGKMVVGAAAKGAIG